MVQGRIVVQYSSVGQGNDEEYLIQPQILKRSDPLLRDEGAECYICIHFESGNNNAFKVFLAITHSLPEMVG